MGKLLEKYISEYNAAIAPGLAKGHEYVVRPEIWIAAKWEDDIGFEPWTPEYQRCLEKLHLEDPELAETICTAIRFIQSQG